MIRGAIDYADQQRVGGWIHSDVASVGGRTVLAFLDKDCVGAGVIDIFRQDLADAGLGDGMVGFNFHVGVADEDIARVTIRLDGSDFSLIQARARIAANESLADTIRSKKNYTMADVAWMQGRGWLDAADYGFLKDLVTIGLSERSVRADTAAADAQRLLELYAQGSLTVAAEPMMPGELVARRLELMADLAVPIVAVQGESGALALLEGSNSDEDFLKDKDMLGAVQHPCSASHLLFLDLRSQFRAIGERAVTIYLPR